MVVVSKYLCIDINFAYFINLNSMPLKIVIEHKITLWMLNCPTRQNQLKYQSMLIKRVHRKTLLERLWSWHYLGLLCLLIPRINSNLRLQQSISMWPCSNAKDRRTSVTLQSAKYYLSKSMYDFCLTSKNVYTSFLTVNKILVMLGVW